MRRSKSLTPWLRQTCREGGAVWARAVPAARVVCAAWVRFKCRFGCDYYGQKHLCPPRTPTPEETAAVVRCYRRALVAVWDAPPDTRGRRAARRQMHRWMLALERDLFLAGYHKALAFAAGPCNLCATCDVSGPCRRPGEPRPAMEACGIDVFGTLRNAGFPLRVITSERKPHHQCGLVLVD